MLKAIIFDHDGTLVDSEPVHFRLWQQVLAGLGFALDADDYQAHYAGIGALDNATEMVARFNLDMAPQHLAERKATLTRAYLADTAFPLLPGVAGTLETLKQHGFRMAIATGANHFAVAATCRHHGLGRYFEAVVCRDHVSAGKPHPETYLQAMAKLGLPSHACLAIEDTAHGMASALAANVGCIAVPTSSSSSHDFSAALVQCQSMSDACRWLLANYPKAL